MVHGFIRGLIWLGAFVNRLQRTMQFTQLGFDAIGLPDPQSADTRLMELLETIANEGIDLEGPF